MIWLSVFDLVRRWPAPAEQGAAIRLPWLTDLLRDGLTKLAVTCQHRFATAEPKAEMVVLSRRLTRFTRLRSQKSFLALLICLVSAGANDECGCEGRIGALVRARGRSCRFKVVMHCLSPGVEGLTKSRHAPGEWRLLQIRSP